MLPAGKLHDVFVIRKKFLAAANVFVDAVFLAEPLISTRTSKEILFILPHKPDRM